ncbi:hypothetical protein [Pseudoduganella lutea]|uniref:Uncharacterized protein n=1 Tax=Pseudoduganella lutea TaxID=321985 RepID=A0A4P6KUA9_9BURK|nr:hypothetical protein [Pseudoduganella lutea]QBE62406.1 hypothetical protein EWM63_04955 [Pseudoduganella lutea]
MSEIIIDGIPSDVTIAGATLEAALDWGDGYLMFVTDDVPNEEMLRIYLLRPDLTIIDSAVLGAMYSTGSFSNLRIPTPYMVQFQFFGGAPWQLTLRPEGLVTLPFFSDPKGVRRPFGFRRFFTLSSNPQPAG